MNILALDAPNFSTRNYNLPPLSPQTNSETVLLTCHIAGTTHRNLHDLAPLLMPDDVFVLRREPENQHDEAAIAVFDERANHIGYIPRKKNEVLSRLLDAGIPLYARLLTKEKLDVKTKSGDWLRLDIAVFMENLSL